MITVIDSPCGAGKTTWAIKYMNDTSNRFNKKFIFITPFLEEITRIKAGLNEKGCEPSYTSTSKTKRESFKELIQQARPVIVTTHATFLGMTNDIIELIKEQNYTLILDETLDVITITDLHTFDVVSFTANKIAELDANTGRIIHTDYSNNNDEAPNIRKSYYRDQKDVIESDRLYHRDYGNGGMVFNVFPPEVFKAFNDVYILTYMFDCQIMYCYFNMFSIKYEIKSVVGGELTEYTRLALDKDLITICHNEKGNRLGKDDTQLSKTWYKSATKKQFNKLKEAMKYALTRKYGKPKSAKEIMWTCFQDYKQYLYVKDIPKGRFIACNIKATNKYADSVYVAYLINRYMNPMLKQFIESFGTIVNDDCWAASELVQFICRSAIRDGKHIILYLPSERMRVILRDYLKTYSLS